MDPVGTLKTCPKCGQEIPTKRDDIEEYPSVRQCDELPRLPVYPLTLDDIFNSPYWRGVLDW